MSETGASSPGDAAPGTGTTNPNQPYTGPTAPKKPAGPTAPTGAGGSIGAPGTSQKRAPTGPGTAVKATTWQSEKNGKGLNDAYATIRHAASVTLPGLHHEFQTIARRPLGG